MAERIEASVILEQEQQLTARIREDVQRIEAQRLALIAQREQDLAELARIEASAAQGVDPPPLTPNPEEQSIQVKNPSKPLTPVRSLLISGLKSQDLKLLFFNLKMMMKNGLDFLLNTLSPFKGTC